MIRTHLVKALYGKILGPEDGSSELVRDPHKKYEIGILNSSYTDKRTFHDRALDSEIDSDPEEIGAETIESSSPATMFENSDALENVRQEIDTDLNFKMGACSLGLYFVLEGESPQFQICATWGRYDRVELPKRKSHLSKRHANFYVTKWQKAGDGDDTFEFKNGVDGNVVMPTGGVFCHILRSRVPNSDKWVVRVFLENKSKFKEKLQDPDRVFQPQIRVVLKDCKLAYLDQGIPGKSPDDVEEDLLYHASRTKARGYLCSAVWKGVDPEHDRDGGIGSISWPDSEAVPENVRDRFTNPDARTEYIPLYTILQPEMGQENNSFSARELSQIWTASDIGTKLGAIPNDYSEWIMRQRKDMEEKMKSGELDEGLVRKGGENLDLCQTTKDRIQKGIDFLKENEKARAAFCFMNVVMNDKRNNEENTDLYWRRFQIAFILQSLRGVSGDSEEDRDTTDVLWFPTGGGKTEAYLGIVIFAIAYRRLLPDGELRNDGGTTVLSRYTLRLLTLQQFHRSVGAILAADLRRVENWLPDNAKKGGMLSDPYMKSRLSEGSLWGRHRISIGLWIGGKITPKDFAYEKIKYGKTVLNAEGELSPYTDDNVRKKAEPGGDPAQMQSCPICNNTLCISKTDGSRTDKLTWIIWSSLPQNKLESIASDIPESQHIKINSRPVFDQIQGSPNGQYYRMTTDISSKYGVLKRNEVDEWWKYSIMPKLDPTENQVKLKSSSPSMPGYFFLYNEEIERPYDFAIFCTNKECRLNTSTWYEEIEGTQGVRVPEPFQKDGSPYISISAPISALTIDEQVYAGCPTFLIATVDKFANLPFVPQCSSIFGNVSCIHPTFGYGRKEAFKPSQLKKKRTACQQVLNELHPAKGFNPPSLILQDELHLIEGPLGSMVGAYEMAVDVLSDNGSKPKYIASSATIREAESQVGTIFRRRVAIFPPPGIISSDNHFSKIDEDVTCAKDQPGRLYLGVATSKSVMTLPIKTQSIIMSEIFKIKNDPESYGLPNDEKTKDEISMYWTFVSYFTDLHLLSKFTNYYKEYMTRHVSYWSPTILPNYPLNLHTTSLNSGLHMFPITMGKDMEISGINVYCVSGTGNASVALYQNDKLLHEFDPQKWLSGTNTFSLPNTKTAKIRQGNTVWLAIKNNDEKMLFESTPEKSDEGRMHKNPEIDSFPDAFDEKGTVNERAIRFSLISPIRILADENNMQLSSDTESEKLTLYLKQLGEKFGIDSLQTSPVFGTGIDMDRLGVMQIMTQPKTNSGYIQSSGRVGRTMPGLVINWLRAGRARDLSHYEDFVGYHRMLHRFVEPITASPFSPEVLKLCLGPLLVAILRNSSSINGDAINSNWITDPFTMSEHADDSEVVAIEDRMAKIALSDFIAEYRKIDPGTFNQIFGEMKRRWSNIAQDLKNKNGPLEYAERKPLHTPEHNVVLGTPNHAIMNLAVAYHNTPNSLRQTESTASFSGMPGKLDQVQLRPSQFLTRYGPGSHVQGKSLAWVVPEISAIVRTLVKIGAFNAKNHDGQSGLDKYEVQDYSMQRILHKYHPNDDPSQLKLFSLPSNASLSLADFDPLYTYDKLSEWVLCYNNLHPSIRVLTKIIKGEEHNSIKCPECMRLSKNGNSSSTNFFSVRYMLACKNGHLGDVDWVNEVHKFSRSCKGNVFAWIKQEDDYGFILSCMGHWDDRGSFIQSSCNARITYSDMKRRSNEGKMQCPGTFAEAPYYQPEECQPVNKMSLAKLISKSQRSIRMPLVRTTMEIKEYAGGLFNLLNVQKKLVRQFVRYNSDYDKESFIKEFEGEQYMNQEEIVQIKNSLDSEFYDAIDKIISSSTSEGDSNDINEHYALELESLENQTREKGRGPQIGPDDPPPDIRFPVKFSVKGLHFEAMPFSDIKVTQVQTGYTREIIPPGSSDVLPDFEENNMTTVGEPVSFSEYYTDEHKNKWYLANSLRGEGIFIHLDPEHHAQAMDILESADKSTIDNWNTMHGKLKNMRVKRKSKSKTTVADEQLEDEITHTHPLFVWWHSFVHSFINQLAIDSGFMGVSLGERVYCVKKSNGYAAGVFVYASSPGADGTLGGLTSLVDEDIIEEIVEKTLDKIQNCSNDPICSSMKIKKGRRAGAACHICLMNSETSCAYQNRFLDRNIVRRHTN